MSSTYEIRVVERLVFWIREKAHESKCEGAVFGMSGGLDSSVLAALCQRAFPRNALGVIMPCGSNLQDREHALLAAARFHIRTTEISLDRAFNALLESLPNLTATTADNKSKARANVKARLRMVVLYHIANRQRYMVVGSGNKSELSVGYFTKYGDGGVDILPLGDLTKTQVRGLARFLDIPSEIIDKPPSAGLWEGQTDEDEMGFTYEELDSYLRGENMSDDTAKKIQSMASSSEHKRIMPPIAWC